MIQAEGKGTHRRKTTKKKTRKKSGEHRNDNERIRRSSGRRQETLEQEGGRGGQRGGRSDLRGRHTRKVNEKNKWRGCKNEERHSGKARENESESNRGRRRMRGRVGTRDREREREMSGRPGENFGEQAFRGTERVPKRGKAELTKPDPNE